MVGFAEVEAAGQCVAEIIGAGIIPGGMEMMDKPAIHAAEAFVHAGYPLDVEALLIIELDGPGVEVDELIARVEAIALGCGSTTCQISTLGEGADCCSGPAARRRFRRSAGSRRTICAWTAPSRAASCRRRWRASAICRKNTASRVANVFHAGDGNLHPLILYDANKPGEMERAEAFGADILRVCVELGGVLTGEHGVGIEKRDLMPEMFSEIDLNAAAAAEMRVRRAGPAQPRQGVSDPAPLRRTRPHACPRRQAGVSGYSEVLSGCCMRMPRAAFSPPPCGEGGPARRSAADDGWGSPRTVPAAPPPGLHFRRCCASPSLGHPPHKGDRCEFGRLS